jgi:outer membrane cobalamin receptor
MKTKPFSFFFYKALAVFISLVISISVFAQDAFQDADTIKSISIDGVVITANRYENRILNSGAAVSAVEIEKINHLPVRSLSGMLKFLPGIYISSPDGMGLNPEVNIRGFYGGGEAEYLTLLVDGIPVNDVESGLAGWHLLPLMNLNRVEALRGGSSALYGDAAMGGVVNLITEKTNKKFTNVALGYGSFNSWNAGMSHGGNLKSGNYEIYFNNESTNGFRRNSNWESFTFGGRLKFATGQKSTLAISSFNQILNSNTPGPLSDSLSASDRLFSEAYYRSDGYDASKYLTNAVFHHQLNVNTNLDISLTYQRKNSDVTRTYTQSSFILDTTFQPIGNYDTTLFGNTKNRQITTNQINFGVRIFNLNDDRGIKATGGAEFDYGGFDNTVNNIFEGFEYDYINNYEAQKNAEFTGEGHRLKTAAYFSGEAKILPSLKVIAGLRYDYISDVFNSNLPVADTSLNKSYQALSPKISLNFNTVSSEYYQGSIFAGYSSAYKAPTIDQRTDLKSLKYALFFPAGPTYQMMITNGNPFSNAQLKPQKSRNFELGAFQFVKFSDYLAADITITGFIILVDDEIDFDLSQFRYRNIQSSSHKGFETSLNLYFKENWSGFFNLNYAEVKFTSGNNDGLFLKGIPKISYISGISYTPEAGLGASIVLNGAGSIFMDDENTAQLDPYAIISTRVQYKLNSISIFFDIENLSDAQYNSNGYLLSEKSFYYPAVGRILKGGIKLTL